MARNRILVVEDDEAISRVIIKNLISTGYAATAIYDGKEAAALLERDADFDLALLDIMLPGIDGFALMGYMKHHDIPVIYLTAKSDLDSKIQGLRDGAEDYIVKPFEVLELLVRIEKVLERTGKMQQVLEVADLTINLKLKENTSLIADGVYDKRIAVNEPDEIGSLAMDFNTMAQAVENRVEELKEEAERRTLFMSALTHELKTPMTSIKGNAETLLMTKMDEDEREAALLQINADCTRIERLSYKLMQLLVLKRSDDIEPKEQKVSDLLDMVYDAAKEQIKQRGLILHIENHMERLKMDKDLLCELLLNLIDNAGKASPRGSTITLLAKNNIISVSDYGHGIPLEELHRLTEPFYMVDKARSRKQGGMGLGLALAQEIARLHGGKLVFESKVGVGTTVKVVFEHEKEAEK